MNAAHGTHQSSNRGGSFASQPARGQQTGFSQLNPFETLTQPAGGNSVPDLSDFSQALSSLPQATPALLNGASAHGDLFNGMNPNAFPGMPGFDTPSETYQQDIETEAKKRQAHMKRHQEIQGWGVEVYNRIEEETNQKIEQILNELKMLSKDLDQTFEEAKGAQAATINPEIATGEGSISFLEKLIKVVMILRKRVKESRVWLHQIQAKQRAKKQGYWGMALGKEKGQGMQWAMSLDRNGGEQY